MRYSELGDNADAAPSADGNPSADVATSDVIMSVNTEMGALMEASIAADVDLELEGDNDSRKQSGSPPDYRAGTAYPENT